MKQYIGLCALIFYATQSMCMTETVQTLFDKAGIFFKEKDYEKAAELYKQVIALNPSSHSVYYNYGVTLFKLHKYQEAQESFRNVLAIKPTVSNAHFYLGKIELLYKRASNALDHFEHAVKHDPANKSAVYALVKALKEELRTEEALTHLRNALVHHPNNDNLQFTYANTLNMAGCTQEALDIYLELYNKRPRDVSITYNIAYTLKKLGRMADCLPYYEKALELNPDHKEANFSLGLAHLVLGDFEKGWEGYEYRWDRSSGLVKRSYDKIEWNGKDSLENKTIFVYAEQGLGDTFQFIRYLRELKNRGAYVLFAPQNPLLDFIALCPYVDEVIPFKQHPKEFDYYISLLSLPRLCKTRIDTIPLDIPYLNADEDLVALWKEKLSHDTNFKIGICWQGNSQYSTAFLRAAVAGKSMTVDLFEPLTHLPNVSVYSLQRVTGTDQLDSLPESMNLITFDEDFDGPHRRFMDTAAVMKNLDLIITIDTSICHLAAGLGVPVWNLLPNPPDWRWMLEREDTPWYPNMRLFRQPTPGDWRSSVSAVITQLKRILNIETPTYKTKSNTQPDTQTLSWGKIINSLAHAYAHDNTERIHTLQALAEPIIHLPLVAQYMGKLIELHTHMHTKQDPELFKTIQQELMAKVDLLVALHKGDTEHVSS